MITHTHTHTYYSNNNYKNNTCNHNYFTMQLYSHKYDILFSQYMCKYIRYV